MKKLTFLFIFFLLFFILFPISKANAELANGATVDSIDVPFVGVQESLVLTRSQFQYFFDPAKNSLSTSGDFTLEAWVKIPQFYPGGTWVVTKDDGLSNRQFSLAVADIQKIAFQVRGVGNLNSSNQNIPLNTWTHIAAVWHSNTKSVDFYINGQYDSSSSTQEVIPSSGNSAELEVGWQQTKSYGNYDGKIAEVRVWGNARTSTEIYNYYNHSLLGSEQNLLAYYPKWTTNNNTVTLNVPLIKQTTLPWGGDVYDSLNKHIADVGCAITSVTMILKSHGYNKLPDGSDLNPGSLNNWLNSQTDGYIDGDLNWGAITRLSREAKTVNNVSFDALEYKKFSGANTNQLTSDLNSNIADILEVPGAPLHFIVAKGITQNSFSINDPYYNYTDLTSYGYSFYSIRRFKPSNTDLSYIVIALDANMDGTITDSNGNIVGESYIENNVEDITNPNYQGIPKRMLIYEKPNTGTYKVKITSNGPSLYKASIYLYDQQANVALGTQRGILGVNNTDTFTINFNKNHNSENNITKVVTFQSLIQDINNLRSTDNIKNDKTKKELVKIVEKMIKISSDKRNKEGLYGAFHDFVEELHEHKRKDITDIGYQILLTDIKALKEKYLSLTDFPHFKWDFMH